jgi:hypothetical protein
MPRSCQKFEESVVPIGCREQQRVAFLTFKDFLDAVSDSPVGPVHVTGNDEKNSNRQMVMGDVSHPEAASNWIQTSFEG